MKSILSTILFLVLFSTSTFSQRACDIKREQKGWPMHYCACYEDRLQLNALPVDVVITDSIWYKSSTNTFILDGMTACLYSACDVQFDIYQRCTTTGVLYSATISQNQAHEIDAESLKAKMESEGVSTANMAIYICIYPVVPGTESRVIIYPYNQGPHSTCSDPLPIIPEMTFVSSNPDDVYVLEPEQIAETGDMYVEWSKSSASCRLQVTRGSCDGEVMTDVEIASTFTLDRTMLSEARANGENLYLHFLHDASTTGRVRLRVKNSTPTAVENLTAPAVDAHLRLNADGTLYVERDNQRYTLTGQRL